MVYSTLESNSLPEEILEKIISLSLIDGSRNHPENESYLPIALLLVCHSFERLAKPIIYSVLRLHSRQQAERLAGTLTRHPELCSYIRGIRLEAPSAGVALKAVFAGINSMKSAQILDYLDLTLIDERAEEGTARCREDLDILCAAITQSPDVRLLIIRQGLYVRQRAVASFTMALAECVHRAANLEAVDIRYRPTPLPKLSGMQQECPFAAALAGAPNLKVLRTIKPTLLNTFFLDVSANPTLERIELVDSATVVPELALSETRRRKHHGTERAMMLAEAAKQIESMPQTLFSSQILAHPRLNALVYNGYLRIACDRFHQEPLDRC